MKELIEQLILMLNESEDYFLIGLLKYKISEVEKVENKPLFSNVEIGNASGVIRRILTPFILNDILISDKYYQKVKKIYNRVDCQDECEKCKIFKNAKKYRASDGYYYFKNESARKVCDSYCKRLSMLRELKENYEHKKVDEMLFVVTEEHIQLRCAINRVRDGLSQIIWKNKYSIKH